LLAPPSVQGVPGSYAPEKGGDMDQAVIALAIALLVAMLVIDRLVK
jgi:hypothetical protein